MSHGAPDASAAFRISPTAQSTSASVDAKTGEWWPGPAVRFHRASYASGVCVCAKATYRKSGGAGGAFMLITSRARAAYRVLSMNGSYGCSTIESEHGAPPQSRPCVSYSGIATQPPSAVPPLTPQPPWPASSGQSAGHDGVPCVRSSPP